ncbi:hypothetical protein [Vibrio mediterranei]|uniref:hypothetical protein n=1 Tax=Vibrio mediterranei TaxID=689 RepID=UPI001F5B44A5|nr:hypothetical protein [Vibrio mediterranei]
MEKFMAASKFAFSIALIVMAASIYNFTQEARQLRLELPTLLAQVDSTAQKITPVIQEIKNIQEIVPQILAQSEEYQRLIPEVLKRIDDVNQQVPVIVNEVAQVREAIPPILGETQKWHQSVPDILAEVDKTNTTVRQTNQQIAATNKQIPLILSESAALRKEVPDILTQAEGLVQQAEQAGREASKGAVSGVIGGILSSPFQLVDKITEVSADTFGLKESDSYTKKDKELHKEAVEALVKNPISGKSKTWSNRSSGNSGVVSIQSMKDSSESRCFTILSRLTIASGPDKGTHSVTTDKCIKL